MSLYPKLFFVYYTYHNWMFLFLFPIASYTRGDLSLNFTWKECAYPSEAPDFLLIVWIIISIWNGLFVFGYYKQNTYAFDKHQNNIPESGLKLPINQMSVLESYSLNNFFRTFPFFYIRPKNLYVTRFTRNISAD